MRKLVVHAAPPPPGYASAAAAIEGSVRSDTAIRTVADSEVAGRRIQAVAWNDEKLAFALDDGQQLTVQAKDSRVRCVASATAERLDCGEEAVLLRLGSSEFRWERGRIAMSYVGRELYRLWFGREELYIYAEHAPILACSCLSAHPGGASVLFWWPGD